MPGTIKRSPRHLDEPLRIGPFTLAQWGIAIVVVALVWLVLTQLWFLPAVWRAALGGLLVGVPLSFTESGRGGSVVELPRRLWRSLATPREYVSGPPRRHPLALQLIDEAPVEEDLPDA
ncbi:MAG TPA: hypothetical protein VFL91_14315 [Thermomicrobiales bacterium]|nr:hypothetical protein [Thermomicrobiales bacterium]